MLCCLQATAAKKGDVNGDNTVNVSDVSVIINKILGVADASNTDVNGDGMTNVSDVSFIINIILGNDIADDTHEYVDLGLPSGTLWASCNVGANKPEDAGLYFAGGETVGYATDKSHDFNWANYKWMTPGQSSLEYVIKYTFADGQTNACWYNGNTYVGTTVDGVTYKDLRQLLPEDDAATAHLGSAWCTPTMKQIEELINSKYTYTEWVTVNGVSGRKVTSNSNGNSIFLPAYGYRYDTGLYGVGTFGGYWTRDIYSGNCGGAFSLYFSVNAIVTYNDGRFSGQNVRAVRVNP